MINRRVGYPLGHSAVHNLRSLCTPLCSLFPPFPSFLPLFLDLILIRAHTKPNNQIHKRANRYFCSRFYELTNSTRRQTKSFPPERELTFRSSFLPPLIHLAHKILFLAEFFISILIFFSNKSNFTKIPFSRPDGRLRSKFFLDFVKGPPTTPVNLLARSLARALKASEGGHVFMQ